MNVSRPSRIRRASIAAATLAAVLGTSLSAPLPAAADGAASTRNIIFGAAAVGGTLLILNHNKKVHEKYAEYDRRQAEDEAAKNQAEAAYESERQAYDHEVALVDAYRQETAYERSQVSARNREIGSLEHSLIVAKYGARGAERMALRSRSTSGRRRVASLARHARHRGASARPVVAQRRASDAPQVVSYGWGTY